MTTLNETEDRVYFVYGVCDGYSTATPFGRWAAHLYGSWTLHRTTRYLNAA